MAYSVGNQLMLFGGYDGTDAIYLGDTWTLTDPTLVTLAGFHAWRARGDVHVNWKTASETDNAGFHLWRSDSVDGSYTRITGNLIPARGTTSSGAEYFYQDTDVEAGSIYWYKLEDIDLSGGSTFHGPIVAEPEPAWGVDGAQSSSLLSGKPMVSTSLGVAAMFIPAAVLVLVLRRRKGRSG